MRVKVREPIYCGVQSACRPGRMPAALGVGFLVFVIALGSCRVANPAGGEVSNAEVRVQGLTGVLERDGLGAALDSLQSVAASDSSVLRNAHQLAHELGRLALESAGSPSIIAQCRPVFSSGCYHGVVEAYVQRRGAVDMVDLERMCARAGGPDTPGPVSECIHGLGHGVLGALSLDLGRTLHYCDALSSPDRRGGCHSGAFMEAVITALRLSPDRGGAAHEHTAHEHGSGEAGRLSIDTADAFSPCAGFDDPYAKACWVYQGFLMLRHVQFDAGQALNRCREAPKPRLAQCAQSIGFQITGLFQRDDYWIIAECSQAPGPLAAECGAGAAAALTSIDWSGGRVGRFCGRAPASWSSACYGSAVRVLRTLASRGNVQRFCDMFLSDDRALCGQRQADSRSRSPASRGFRVARSTISRAGR